MKALTGTKYSIYLITLLRKNWWNKYNQGPMLESWGISSKSTVKSSKTFWLKIQEVIECKKLKKRLVRVALFSVRAHQFSIKN